MLGVSRRRLRAFRPVVISTVTAMVVSLGVALSPPAQAADPGVGDTRAMLQQLADWSKGLGGVGKLGQALPLLSSSPGAPLGFDDALQKAIVDKFTTASAWDDLNYDQDITIAGSRTGHLKTAVSDLGGGKKVSVDLSLKGTATSEPLSFADSSGAVKFAAGGGVKVESTLTLHLDLVWAGAGDIYLVKDANGPSILVHATASLPNPTSVSASIGILGVTLGAGSTLAVDAHFKASVNDPNSDGKLYFDAPGGGANDGELGAPNSLTGLVTMDLDNPAGSASGHFIVNAAPTSGGPNLPSVSATIDVAWPDIAAGSPTVTTSGLTSVADFLTMSPLDLAQGLAQVTSALDGLQRRKLPSGGNVDLPFMKGTVADAVKLNETLKTFLTKWVYPNPNPPDPAKAGQPKFQSLQELVQHLGESLGVTGLSITVTNLDYDPTKHKVALELALTHTAPASPQPLDAAGALASGGLGSTYDDTHLADGTQNWTTDQWKGRRVVAGNVGGIVASNDAHTITLDKPWSGPTPADGSPYSINDSAAQNGSVTFADLLTNGSKQGVHDANAATAVATVTPSYLAHLTLVLDLQPAKTGNDCSPNPCPYTVTNQDGSKTIVNQQPLGVDRVLIRTKGVADLFTASIPIHTDVDLFANAGFFEVRLKGSLRVCAATSGTGCDGSDTGDPMVSIKWKTGLGDADGDLSMADLFSKLVDDPTSLVTYATHIDADAALTASIPDAATFLPAGSGGISATWDDIGGGTSPVIDTSHITELFKLDFSPDDPHAYFTVVLKTLQTLADQIDKANPGGAFDTKIPVLGQSFRDLLRSSDSGGGKDVTYTANTLKDPTHTFEAAKVKGRTVVAGTEINVVKDVLGDGSLQFTDNWKTKPADGSPYIFRTELDDAISLLQAFPPDSMQRLVSMLKARLGNNSLVKLDYQVDGTTPSVVVGLDWKRGYSVTSPVRFDFSTTETGARSIVGTQANGSVSLDVTGDLALNVVVPLTPPTTGALPDIRILDNSHISLGVSGGFSGTVQGNIGPLSVSLGNPKGSEKAVAQGKYKLSLKDSAADPNDPQPADFSTFASGLDLGLDDTGPAAVCNGVNSGGADLSLCANLPLYVSADGTNWNTATSGANAFVVRMPQSTSLSDAFDFGGADVGGFPRLETPDGQALLDALQAAILDFSKLGDGFDGYLAMLQQGLQTASAGGKLPLIGEDLQEGADFIGHLRQTLDDEIWSKLPNNGRIPDVSGIQEWLNDKLKTALTDAGLNPDSFSFEFTCTTKLAPVTGTVTLTPAPTGGAKHYEYAIAAVTTNATGTSSKDATLSTPVATTDDGPATIDGTHTITVSWSKSEFADGYRVVRRATSADPWKEVSDKDNPVTGTGSTITFEDKGEHSTDYTAASEDPVLQNCDHGGVQLADISGVQIRVNLGQGTVSAADGCSGSGCLTKTLPLDIGIPGLALKADQTAGAGNGVKIQLGWQLHLVFGLDRTHGFFVKTKDEPNPELGVGIAVRMPTPGGDGTQLKAQLAILNISIKNAGGASHADDALFAGAFGVDIRADATNTGEFLTLASIQDASSIGDLIHPVLSATVNIDWTLDADIDQALPGVHVEDFIIKWSWSNDAPGSNENALHIAFNGVKIDAGSFFSNLFGPVLKQLKTVTGPLQPVIDTLYAPIPVLSDLSHLAGGDDVTLITLAKTFSTLLDGPKLDFVDRVAAIITLVNKLPTAGNVMIDVGDFDVVGSDALHTPNTPDSGGNLIGTNTPNTNLAKNLNSANTNGDGSVLSTSTDTSKPDPNSTAGKAGFSFPIVQKPTTVFKLLMGQDIDLVTFDSGPLTLGFDWRQSFGPIYAPPPVMLTLSGGASVTAHIVAGFDTYGIRLLVQQIQDGTATPAQGVADVLSGLYFRTTDDDGKPIPVVTFYGEIAAGAAVSAVIIEVGIEGGLSLTINFNWRDPNNDGKFRISEFLATALSNPLCLFTVDGKIALFIRVYITIGFSPFSVTFSFTLANITLLDFSVQADCTPPPPILGGVSADGTLYLFAGKLGHPGQRGGGWDNPDGDQFKVTELHDFPASGDPTYRGVAVDALGEHWEFLNSVTGEIKRVVVDANSYGHPMKVTFTGDGDKSKTGTTPDSPKPKTTPFDLPVFYAGGTDVDTVLSGQGSSFIDGSEGADVITTADDPSRVPGAHATVAGGLGDDNITVGGGNDTVAGDSTLGYPTETVSVHRPDTKAAFTDAYPGGKDISITVLKWSAFDDATPSSDSEAGVGGKDHLSAGLGKNNIYGNGGDDSIGIAADSPQAKLPGNAGKPQFVSQGDTIVGGDGTDQIASGSGSDTIYTADKEDTTEDGTGHTDAGTNVSNTVDTGTGSDTVYGGTAPDFVTGHSLADQKDRFYGGSGEDVLAGGFGEDEIFGGPGDDWVVAEPSTISGVTGGDPFTGVFGPYRTVTHLPLPQGTAPSHKLLVGGDDNDHIVGGDGGADIFGDRHRDACVLGSDPESTPPTETADGVGEHAGRDLVLGGEGVDVVAAGGADDRVESFGGNDRDCGQAGADVILAGTGDDVAYGGTGNDVEQGDSGADRVYGNDGVDTLYGNQGTDILEGNDGSDTEFGGTENDLVVGGTRKAAATDTGGDTLYGDDGNDTLIGDNGTGGTPGDPNDRPRPFDLTGLPATAGAADTIYGGNGDDLGFGGLGDDVMSGGPNEDHFEGNNDSDTINGDQGEDEVVGGSFEVSGPNSGWPAGRPDSGDVLNGGAGPDVVVGDNADVARVGSGGSPLLDGRGFQFLHSITLLDLGFSPVASTSGDDQISGDAGNDVLLGQGGQDRIKGGTQDDYAEGGQGADWVEGNAGDDDLVGGSSSAYQGSGLGTSGQPDTADSLWGGGGDDVAIGDNGVLLRTGTFTKSTDRLGTTSAGNRMARRQVVMYDLSNGNLLTEPTANRFGGDQISGGQGVDVLYGQDGADSISGGGDGDYLEGNGGTDQLRGDLPLDATGDSAPVPPLVVTWPGAASAGDDLNGPSAAAGQDDEIGGSSMQGFRDAADLVEGDGAADVQLGDNGSLVRTVNGSAPGTLTESVYTARYPNNAVPADATRQRTHDPALPGPSTRFCSQGAASATCEVAGAFGADTMYGDGGDDGMWGQDGNDVMRGGDGRDDMYGELGDDQMWGENGDDAMVGDRGGVADYYLDGVADPGTPFTVNNGGVPKETYKGLQTGSYARQFDLLHDVDGNSFVGTSSATPMAHAGLTEGGNDRMRGGNGADNVHGGYGDDLANGDSGGDQVFGDDGADVLWGGKGCDPVVDAAAPDCNPGGTFDPAARGTNDRMVDHVFGGAGATSGPSIAGALGSDLLDFNPRGTYSTCTDDPWPLTVGSGVTEDPCDWFEMTDKTDADASNNQHHQGTDWLYGGWDRDVLQGDVAQNGPNPGDRLLDWNGAYNLYTHCNSAYGGYNDVRQHSPSMQDFLQKLVWGSGAGQQVSDATTSGTSAFRELALVSPGADNAHGSGSAFPSTPGHFDDPASCSD